MLAPPKLIHLMRPAPTFLEADWRRLASFWHPVCRSQDVAQAPMAVMLLDLPLVVWRSRAGVRVARDLCPHRGVPLSQGSVEDGHLVCPYHGLAYAADGACVRVPAHPGSKPSEHLRLGQFSCIERYGLVWACLTPGADAGLPRLGDWNEPGFQQVSPAPIDIATSAARQIEGFIDVAHFAWVHDQSFADREQPQVPPYEVIRTERGLKFDYVSHVSNFPHKLQGQTPTGFLWRRSFEVHLPFCATLTVHFPDGKRHGILNAASPVTATATRLFTPLARNFTDIGTAQDAAAFKTLIVLEDRKIAEAQWPKELPLDPELEASFPADRASVMYRRQLRELGLTLFATERGAKAGHKP